ncbi:MAG: efflux RND transporter permease subunit [Deltaproteobacteria bacterium]|nr:efflux RND transporter permease subunit [Deltaproteobacteria bacterium]
MKLAEWSVKNSLLVNLLTLFIMFVGAWSLFTIKREAFPNIKFDIVQISTVYPGSTPEQVEKLLTIPLEKELKEVDDIKEMVSASVEGLSLIYLTIEPGAEDKVKVVNDIQRAVDRVEDLPSDLEDKPVVEEISTKNTPVIEVALYGDVSSEELREQAKRLEDIVLENPEVASVVRRGYREPEFSVEVDPGRIREAYVSLAQVMNALSRTNVNIPGGTIDVGDREVILRVSGEFFDLKGIEETVVRANDRGYNIKIKDIAQVVSRLEEETITNRTNENVSVNLQILKKESGDIIELVEDLKSDVNKFLQSAPKELDPQNFQLKSELAELLFSAKKIFYNDNKTTIQLDPFFQHLAKFVHQVHLLNKSRVKVALVNDVSYYVKRRLGVLINNGVIGLILLMIPLVLFLSPRTALSAILGMVTAILAAFALMDFFGISINLMSLFGLIMVLGMLVDEDIVIAENIHRYIEEGMPPKQAAIKGTSEVMLAVIATVLTTITAFLPLIIMSGIIGKFVRQIPMVVIITLVASLIQAVLVLPSHMAEFNRMSEKRAAKEFNKRKGSRILDFSLNTYEAILRFLIRFRYLAIILFGVFSIGTILFGMARVPFILFPSRGIEQFFIRYEGKIGTPVETTTAELKKIEKIIHQSVLPHELDSLLTQGGITQNDPNDPFSQRASHVGQIHVFLTPERDRKRSAQDIIKVLRSKIHPLQDPKTMIKEHLEEVMLVVDGVLSKTFNPFLQVYTLDFAFQLPRADAWLDQHFYVEKTRFYFDEVRAGPPIGKPVAVRIKGDDFPPLNKLADEYIAALKQIPGVKDIKSDFENGKDELTAHVDVERMARAGLTYQDIARAVRIGFDGGVATTIKKGDEEVDVVVRFPEHLRDEKSSLDLLLISNSRGDLIPLSEIASFNRKPSIAAIKHDERKRLVTVSANVDEKITTSGKVNTQLEEQFKKRLASESNVLVKYGGEEEDTQESLDDLKKAFILAMLLIFIILAVTFRSLWEPFVIMTTIPMGILGVIIAFYLDSEPLSFLAFLGIVGFAGVVVDSGIILIDFVHREHKKRQWTFHESIIKGSRLRFRAIILTTLTTILGVFPAAFGIGGRDPFIQPMAKAMNWGIASGSLLAAFMIPVLLAVFGDWMSRLKHQAHDE